MFNPLEYRLSHARDTRLGLLPGVASPPDPTLLPRNSANTASSRSRSLTGTDRRAIQAAGEKVDRLTAPFAQRRIERDLAVAITGRMAGEVGDQLGMSDEA